MQNTTNTLIIPCHIRNQRDVDCLYRLLDSVQRQSRPFTKVFVVDDASPYPYEFNYDFAELIRLSDNGGPAKARNVGIDLSLSLGARNLMFTDHDCVLDGGWHESMSSFLEDTRFGAAGGMTYSFGKTIYDYYHNVNGTLNGKWLLPEKQELWYMPSLNFAMKAEVARDFRFDEAFPTAAGEDVDLCLRLRSKYKIGFCRKAKLWHDYGYNGILSGLLRFIKLFMKYKSSSATLYEGHTVLLWDESEAIHSGNTYEPHLQ